MAQSGFSPILIYGSTTTGNTPSASNLTTTSLGVELAINATDGKLFYKDNAGNVQTLATKATGTIGGSNTQVQYNSSGALAGSANMTFSGTALTLANDASISGLTVGKGGSADTSGTALGVSALASNNAIGNQNTAVGYQAMTATTSGYNSVGVGYKSLVANTTGNTNSSFGAFGLYTNTTGSSNTALGYQSLFYNTTASYNTALGYQAGFSNTTAVSNVYLGNKAGYTNSTGSFNTIIGDNAGYTLNNSVTYGGNTLFGAQAGYALTTGVNNTFVGAMASTSFACGSLVTTGSKNTIIGAYSGNQGSLDIRTASNYIVLSDGDGNPRGVFINNGDFCIGQVNDTNTPTQGHCFSVGTSSWLASGHVSGAGSGTAYAYYNYAGGTIGSITQNGTTGVLYNIVSDRRLKENIVDAPSALSLIDSVKVRSFDFKSDGSHTEFGLIAQEFYEVAPECVSKGDDNPDVITDTWGLDSSALVPAMIKAIQEQQALITTMQAKLKDAGVLGF